MSRLFLWSALAASLWLIAGDAFAQKKVKLDQKFLGWCWEKVALDPSAQRPEHRRSYSQMCFGSEGILKVEFGNSFEASAGIGLYRSSERGEVQFVGFPGEGWFGQFAMIACTYEFAGEQNVTMTDCKLDGVWKRTGRYEK